MEKIEHEIFNQIDKEIDLFSRRDFNKFSDIFKTRINITANLERICRNNNLEISERLEKIASISKNKTKELFLKLSENKTYICLYSFPKYKTVKLDSIISVDVDPYPISNDFLNIECKNNEYCTVHFSDSEEEIGFFNSYEECELMAQLKNNELTWRSDLDDDSWLGGDEL